jgi:hypothetical protein
VPQARRGAPPSFLREPLTEAAAAGAARLRRSRHAADPARRGVSPEAQADTVPMSRSAHRGPEPGTPRSAVAYALETPATGLRKFDLGTVPASVTPPRSWRKAAWFAVGTSAAVVLGLTVATVELMGRPVDDGAMIDSLPAYPSGPLTLGELPHEQTTPDAPVTNLSTTRRHPSGAGVSVPPSQGAAPTDTVTGGTTGEDTLPSTGTTGDRLPGTTEPTTEPTTQGPPTRTTVGPAPVTPTDPQQLGDVTEQYFQLVTTDPKGAHALTTGGMAREGAAGIEARYGDVERIEVRDITIDRNEATTTSTVRVVREDGTTTVERRRLTFTWGSEPKITEDMITG